MGVRVELPLSSSRGMLRDVVQGGESFQTLLPHLLRDDNRLYVLYRLCVLCGPMIPAIIGVTSPTVLEIGTGVFMGRKKAYSLKFSNIVLARGLQLGPHSSWVLGKPTTQRHPLGLKA